MIVRIGVAVLAAATLAGCTGSGGSTPSTPVTSTIVETTTAPAPPTAPVDTGPTTAASATSCPYAASEFVHDTLGMRLSRLTVLRSGGRVVGCRFYPLTHPTPQCDASCLQGEHLPGPNQPVLEISTTRYPSPDAAHNGFVRVADAGKNPQPVQLGGGIVGVCFQTDFYPKDHGADYACATSKGSTALVVRSVDTVSAYNTKNITTAVLPKIPA